MHRKIGKAALKALTKGMAGLGINPAPNSQYKVTDFFRVILLACLDNKFIESASRHLRSKGRTPSGDDVFYHLIGKGDENITIGQVYNEMSALLRGCFLKAKKIINIRSPVCLAIDFTDMPYYGKEDIDAQWIVGCKNVGGTNKAHRFISVHIVMPGKRFTIATIPVNVFDKKEKLVGRLITEARKYVSVRYVFFDRGFYSVGVIKQLLELDVSFIVPVIKHDAKKPEKDMLQLLRCHCNKGSGRFKYTLGNKYDSVTFTVVAVEGKDADVFGFATNTHLPAKTIGEWYGKRWGIETGYRVKEEFRPRTCSKPFSVRLLLNMLSFVLYNVWVLVNVILRFRIGRRRFLPRNRSYLPAYDLCKILKEFLSGPT